jgi:HSP20 family molecular chaperone IbpA
LASDPKNWMWERARTILDEAERIEREFLRVRPVTPAWAPAVDVLETTTELWVLVAIPGVEPGAIEVLLEGARLVLSGMRTVPPGLRQALVHRLEIPRGRFERRVDLPPGVYEITQREAVHGCLALNLRRL